VPIEHPRERLNLAAGAEAGDRRCLSHTPEILGGCAKLENEISAA
jgi:hypothetical protein